MVTQPSDDPDQAAAETIALMVTYIKDSARDPLVQATAHQAVEQFAGMGMSGSHDADVAESCWAWVKHNLQFVHHSKLLALWMGNRDALQLLISPDVIIHAINGDDRDAANRARKGDCAVYSPLVCALLECLGYDWELVIAAVNPNQPDIFSHVWPRVVLPNGRRVSLDASHGKYAGWRVPDAHISRLQAFDSSGRPIPFQEDSFVGFGEYFRTGMGEDPNSSVDLTQLYPVNPAAYDTAPPTTPITSPVPSGGFDWSSLIGNLANQWTQIGGRVIAPQTTYSVGPNGQISYSTPGAAPVPSGFSTSLGSGTLGWVLGGGLVLVLAIAAFGGKK